MQRPTLDFAHISEYAFIDRSGKLSLVAMFSRVLAKTFPLVVVRLCIGARITGLPVGHHVVTVTCAPPGMDPIPLTHMDMECQPAGDDTGMLVSQLSRVRFNIPGRWAFGVSVDDHHIGGTDLEVVRIEAARN